MKQENIVHPSGMVRGSTAGKVNYLLVYDGPLLDRWAIHLTNAVPSKGKRNWMHASTPDDLERFREGLARHVRQYLADETDEDHAAAIVFNLNGAEYVRGRLAAEQPAEPVGDVQGRPDQDGEGDIRRVFDLGGAGSSHDASVPSPEVLEQRLRAIRNGEQRAVEQAERH